MKIYRTNDISDIDSITKCRCKPIDQKFAFENDLSPMERATVKELRAKLQKASDDMDAHDGEASYEAAFKAAQKQYDDFMDKAGTKTNAVTIFRK